MSASGSCDAWHLTVVRAQGLQARSSKKSWCPFVTILVDEMHNLEVPLGRNGEGAKVKVPFALKRLEERARLDINLWHVSRKSRKSRIHIASASVSVREVLRRQSTTGSDVDIRLALQSSYKQKGGRKVQASLTLRIVPPGSRPVSLSPAYTAVSSPSTSAHEDEDLSDPSSPSSFRAFAPDSEGEDDELWPATPLSETRPESFGLRRRRQRGFEVESGAEDTESVASTLIDDDAQSTTGCIPMESSQEDFLAHDEGTSESVSRFSSILCYFAPIRDAISVQTLFWLLEWFLSKLSPYSEMTDATSQDDYEKLMGRLLTEWYAIGASLLTLAGINTAVFGFPSGTLFEMDDRARTIVSIGAITAGLGIVFDAWLLLVYSGASPARFQHLSLDVYNTHIFFCLICRLPTVCMFLSAVSMMLFLSYVASPSMLTVMLVIFFFAGTLLTLQYFVRGSDLLVKGLIWLIRSIWRSVRVRCSADAEPSSIMTA